MTGDSVELLQYALLVDSALCSFQAELQLVVRPAIPGLCSRYTALQAPPQCSYHP